MRGFFVAYLFFTEYKYHRTFSIHGKEIFVAKDFILALEASKRLVVELREKDIYPNVQGVSVSTENIHAGRDSTPEDEPCIFLWLLEELDNVPLPKEFEGFKVNSFVSGIITPSVILSEEDTVPLLVQQGQDAFHRDLRELLRLYPGKWVAYSGDKRIGIGDTETELYKRCFTMGLKRGQFVVRSIEPQVED